MTNTDSRNWQLSPDHLARVEGWGMAVHCIAHTYYPQSIEAIEDVFALARRTGRAVCLRGGGNSYGDAAILGDGIVMDLSRMNRILHWDPTTGIIDVEPGVTIEMLWKTIIHDSWWPPVVSGTMFTTMGGCAAMNIHGKNNFRVGTFGEHVLEFDFLTPDGTVHTVTPQGNPDLFHAAISGAGLLGVFTRLRLQMKRVHSGMLSVEAFNTDDLASMKDEFERRAHRADYLVGWVDGTTTGRRLGRGIVHAARYLAEGEDPRPEDSLTVAAQGLPDKLFGFFPKALLHYVMSPFINNPGVRLINTAKYVSGHLQPRSSIHYQSHAAFAFLLDYVPNWKHAYKPVGLIQYQAFVPAEHAVSTYEKLLRMSHTASLPPYLGVFKKHRPDAFLLSHAVDGYSLALDYRVTPSNRDRLWALARQMDEIVLAVGGRFYFAKDATLTARNAQRYLGDDTLAQLRRMKQQFDPDNILQSELAKRLLGATGNP